jgi:zinc transporter ZupT
MSHVENGGMSPVLSALLWGAGSAATFPAGAIVGIFISVSHQTLGLMMAFAAGTLIFAVAVEVRALQVAFNRLLSLS